MRFRSKFHYLLTSFLAFLTIGGILWIYSFGSPYDLSGCQRAENIYSGFIWATLPSLPFGLLGYLALQFGSKNNHGAICGASLGVAISFIIPFGSLCYSTFTYSGGGANIGVGILLLGTIIYVPLFAIIGWSTGKITTERSK